jgi:hypothetical protein
MHLSGNARFLLAVWAVFILLVGFGIHGAPTPAIATAWSDTPYTGYVFSSIADSPRLKSLDSSSLRQILMTVPPAIRSDDYLVRFPLALSQLSHKPRFPVVNTNYWTGINMLVQAQFDVPVWHIAALARPASWGYFFLGAQRGVAWEWWFDIFACFTVLYLLIGVILNSDMKLAAFGALWFCESAYIVCVGYWPTYVTFFAALATLSAYHLLRSQKPRIQLLCGALLGLAVSGFIMILYPPWNVPLGYLFLAILIGLIIRDRLFKSLTAISRTRVLAIALAILIVAIIIGCYLSSCWADLKVMANTSYPGGRRTSGGGFAFWRLFSGAYNLLHSFQGYDAPIDVGGGTVRNVFINQTEASSYYLLFPALAAPLCLSKRWRNSFGLVCWILTAYLALMLLFMRVGMPRFLAAITMFDRAVQSRVILEVGLVSIILCLRGLQCARTLASSSHGRPSSKGRIERILPVLAGLTIVPIYAVSGLFIASWNKGTPAAPLIAFVSLIGGLAAYLMVSGKARAFCGLVAIAVLTIPLVFNCLSTNLDYIYRSELAGQITRLNNQADRPLWVCYGLGNGRYTGMLVAILGGRTVAGIDWPPALDFWRAVDSSGTHEELYNTFAHVYLHYTDDDTVSFSKPVPWVMEVSLRPDNPALKQMGAKYILATDGAARQIDINRFPIIYKSAAGDFSIFEIP